MRGEGPFLLDAVAQVLIGHDAVKAALAAVAGGKLEVDDGGFAVGHHQPVLRLGQIVVGNAAPAHVPQQSARVFVPDGRLRARQMQRRAIRPGPEQAVCVDVNDIGCSLDAGNGAKRPDFALRQEPGERTRPQGRGGDDAARDPYLRPIREMAGACFGKHVALEHRI